MTNATLTFSASMEADGETKTISSNATLSVEKIQTGKQTVGNIYETLALTNPNNTLVIIYNPSSNDVAVRMEVVEANNYRYHFYNVIAGGIFVVPREHMSDAQGLLFAQRLVSLAAKTDSGTAEIEYCIIG
jgi:hypothetical protein